MLTKRNVLQINCCFAEEEILIEVRRGFLLSVLSEIHHTKTIIMVLHTPTICVLTYISP